MKLKGSGRCPCEKRSVVYRGMTAATKESGERGRTKSSLARREFKGPSDEKKLRVHGGGWTMRRHRNVPLGVPPGTVQ